MAKLDFVQAPNGGHALLISGLSQAELKREDASIEAWSHFAKSLGVENGGILTTLEFEWPEAVTTDWPAYAGAWLAEYESKGVDVSAHDGFTDEDDEPIAYTIVNGKRYDGYYHSEPVVVDTDHDAVLVYEPEHFDDLKAKIDESSGYWDRDLEGVDSVRDVLEEYGLTFVTSDDVA